MQIEIDAGSPDKFQRSQLARVDKPEAEQHGGEDGLDFYRAIIAEYKKALKAGGMLAFEVGAGEAAAVEALLEDAGLKEINTEKDLGGICRAVYGIKK